MLDVVHGTGGVYAEAYILLRLGRPAEAVVVVMNNRGVFDSAGVAAFCSRAVRLGATGSADDTAAGLSPTRSIAVGIMLLILSDEYGFQ